MTRSHEEFWQQLAKVAMGLQGDDPVNWPHYAEEARRLTEERDRYRECLVDLAEGWVGNVQEKAWEAIQ